VTQKPNRLAPGPIDLDALLALVGGEPALFAEVAELGASDIGRLLALLDSAATAFAMVEPAHELKGVLLNLQAAAAAHLASALELAARTGDLSASRALLRAHRPTFDRVAATLLGAVQRRAAS
jgi:HPt (histidine-containing phosphotransfer) domain-containing protein